MDLCGGYCGNGSPFRADSAPGIARSLSSGAGDSLDRVLRSPLWPPGCEDGPVYRDFL